MRTVRRILVPVLVLGVLLVVADRVGVWLAQRVVADQVTTELANHQLASDRPEVRFESAPFLTQVAAGRYESVELLLRNVGSGGVRLPLVELTATGVTASAATVVGRAGPIDAERVDGTATIGYETVVLLTQVPDLTLSGGADGVLRIELPTVLQGVPVTLVGTAVVEVAGADTIRIRVTELAAAEPDTLPPGSEPLVDDLAQQLSVLVPLPPLPYRLAVESVQAGSAGLVIQMVAHDVPLAR